MFYLLLLALSEHLGFATAYTVATLALVSLLTAYLSGVTASRRSLATIAGVLTTAYGALYAILLSEDDALLLGALLLFAILAALMLVARRVDWAGPLRSRPG
jgi:inner membrane protein